MQKIILDTNVLLSALIHKGRLKTLLDYVFAECILLLSPALISEMNDKLKNRFEADEETIGEFLDIVRFSELFSPSINIDFPEDPDDAFLLELAEAAAAHYLITGDRKHLLPLKKWKKTKIISPSEFLSRLL